MNILITGAAGFIGAKVKEFLEQKKFNRVDCLDMKHNKEYVYNMANPEWISRLPKDYDYIVHCAAQSGGYLSLIDPVLDCDWNCRATVNLVEFAKQNKKIKNIIYTSSMAVYGDGKNRTENSPINPISYYAVSKLAGEGYIKLAWHHNSIPYTIFRLWNTYGHGQDLENPFQGMLSIYLSQALESNIIKIKGDKSRTRDFVHVDDVVNAIYMSMKNPSKFQNETFNICTGIETSTEHLNLWKIRN